MKILGVTESTTRLLRLEIITGHIPPGSKLNEIELSNRYGVSRPPLREAFRKLEYENLIVSIPRKGAYVTKLSLKDCKDVYYTRHVIECAAIDAIADIRTLHLGSLRKAIKQESNTTIPQEDDSEGLINYYNEIASFHWLLVKASGNRWLTHCYQSIGATLTRYQIIYYAIPGTRQPAIDDHLQILHLIEERKTQEAKTLLVSHILDGLDKLIRKMQNSNAKYRDYLDDNNHPSEREPGPELGKAW